MSAGNPWLWYDDSVGASMWDGVRRAPGTWNGLHGRLCPPVSLQGPVNPRKRCSVSFSFSPGSNTLLPEAGPQQVLGEGLRDEQPAHRILRSRKEGGSTRPNAGKSRLILQGLPGGVVAPTGGRSRKDKGIPEGGRRGRLHNWKISESPDFKLFKNYLKIWQPRACTSPWQHQLVLSGRGPPQTGHAL